MKKRSLISFWFRMLIAGYCMLSGILIRSAYGQQGEPKGVINRDTVRTGETFSFSLSYRHPSQVEVFFPDSTYNFQPFQFRRQEIFPTQTNELGSLDSTVYHLVSFEVTPVISLALPIYIFNGKDCTAVFSVPDTSFVALSVDLSSIDTLEVVNDMSVLPIKEQINYSAYLIALILSCVAVFLINWLFGRKIRQQWNVFQLMRRHREFTKAFTRHYTNAKNKGSVSDVEKALILWKSYLERLENKPFTTFTTREISDNISDNSLSVALRETDRVIYGSSAQGVDIGNSLLALNNIAQTMYLNKRKSIVGATS